MHPQHHLHLYAAATQIARGDMRLGRRLQSTLSTCVNSSGSKYGYYHNQRQYTLFHTARNLTFLTTTRQRPHPSHRLTDLPSLKPFTSTHLQYSSQTSPPPQTSSPAAMASDTKPEENGNSPGAQQQQQPGTPDPTPDSAPLSLPALPPTSADGGASSTLEVNGEALRLDHLGPLVVNVDGTLSRIANWEKMADIERENTLRILGKRNQMRLAKLRAAGREPAGGLEDEARDS